jgi:hypothetical protein
MAPRRTVTAADVTAAQAQPKVNPRRAKFQALLAAERTRLNGFDTVQVMATHRLTSEGLAAHLILLDPIAVV